jgi:hypothetical protein
MAEVIHLMSYLCELISVNKLDRWHLALKLYADDDSQLLDQWRRNSKTLMGITFYLRKVHKAEDGDTNLYLSELTTPSNAVNEIVYCR